MTHIVGIDIGFAATGVVIVELPSLAVRRAVVYRTQKTAKKRGIRVADDDAERCQALACNLLVDIGTWKRAGRLGIVVELPHGGAQGARANRAMGMATGIVAACVEAEEMSAEWVTPAMVKKAACGRQSASKEEVQAAVSRCFDWGTHWPKLKGDWEHVGDAAGAILAAQGGTMYRMLMQIEAAG